MIRTTLFWLHLAIGVSAGVIILLMSATGVLLAFERQIVAWAERDLHASPAEIARGPLPLATIVERAAAGQENPVSAITLRSDPAAPLAVSFGRGRTIFVNRYTGEALGEGAVRVRAFFDANVHLHRWLALEGDGRDVGKAVTGAANLGFLFITLSGAILWIPRRRGRNALRNVMLFRRGLRGQARDFNWHNVLGIWTFLPLALIVFSASVISYPWMTGLVYRAFGEEAPVRGGGSRSDAAELDSTRLGLLWSAAISETARVAPDWRAISLRLPLSEGEPASFSLDRGNGARPDKRSQIVLDATSGAFIEHKTYAQQGRGQKVRSWLRWIHTGEAGGIPGQIVAMLASAAAVVLVWTGISLALRRFARAIRRARTPLISELTGE